MKKLNHYPRNARLFMAALLVILVILITVGAIAFSWPSTSPSSGNTVASPTPGVPNANGRITRNLTESSWTYSVDSTYEKKFDITVTNEGGGPSQVITLSGKGCNHMSVVASREISPNAPALSRRDIHGERFVLGEPTTTLMACQGEAANYDQLLTDEFKRIFESIN